MKKYTYTEKKDTRSGFGDGLTQFSLGTIDNSTGCSSGGYEDYSSSMSTDLVVGNDYTLTTDNNLWWGGQFITVWIDYNDNSYFEESEKIVDGLSVGTGETTTQITIDPNADLGEHLLRIKSGDNQNQTQDPCMDMTYGETEDYKVNLVSDLGNEEIESPGSTLKIISVEGNSYVLEFSDNFLNNGTIEIHNSLGQLVYTAQINNESANKISVDLSKYANGAYLVNIKNNDTNSVIKLIKR